MTFIRAVTQGDLPALKNIIDETGLFPPDMLDAMLADHLAGDKGSYWFSYRNGEAVAMVYGVPEPMTSGTWNALLLAVHPEVQGQGIGAALMMHSEQMLAERGARILLVETSGLDAFKRTRDFYQKIGYEQEARIRDFYDEGEDKIVFRKVLGSS